MMASACSEPRSARVALGFVATCPPGMPVAAAAVRPVSGGYSVRLTRQQHAHGRRFAHSILTTGGRPSATSHKRQHGLDGTPTSYRTIESMAAAYLEDVRRYQPQGPYALGGYSAGGCIALEMARQLVAAGEDVERVVMLDSWGPAMVGRDFHLRFNRLVRRLRFEGPRFLSTRLRAALARVRPAPAGAIALRNVPGEKTVFANVELGNVVVDALHEYKFVPVEVPVTLITAVLRDPETRFLPGDLGWKRFLPGINVTPVAVPHITMCTGTNAPHVARAIADALGD